MSPNPQNVVGIEKKISVYIALIMAGLISLMDIHTNGSVLATMELSLAFIAFAGGRQALKSLVHK